MKLRRLFLTLAAATALVASAAELSDSTACRLSLWPAVTDAGISLALNAGITETFKHTVHEWRPDGSDDRSSRRGMRRGPLRLPRCFRASSTVRLPGWGWAHTCWPPDLEHPECGKAGTTVVMWLPVRP